MLAQDKGRKYALGPRSAREVCLPIIKCSVNDYASSNSDLELGSLAVMSKQIKVLYEKTYFCILMGQASHRVKNWGIIILDPQVCGKFWEVQSGIPLYRLYRPTAMDHLYTTSAPERDNAKKNLGFSDEGIAGYVVPA